MSTSSRRRSHAAGASAEQCARRVLEFVPEVMRHVRSEMRRGAGETLSVPQFRVLAFLGRHADAPLSALAAFLGVSGPTASAAVERLVRRGLVTRRGDPRERRRVQLGLTPAGVAIVRRAGTRARARIATRLRRLPARERAAMARGLEMLRDVLGAPEERA